MSLSVSKLESMLSERGFVPRTYFVIHSICIYIEIVSNRTADVLLMYIPSKYKFEIKGVEQIHKLKYIDMENNESSASVAVTSHAAVNEAYPGIEVGSLEEYKGDLETQLAENYNHPLTLDSIDKDDQSDLRDIYRQMKRIRHCVQNIKYKVSVIYKNYLCGVRRDGGIDCFVIKHFRREDANRRLLITIDLEVMYDKVRTIFRDVNLVREGIYAILRRNQVTQITNMKKMMEEKKDVTSYSESCLESADKLDVNIARYEELFVRITQAEREKLTKIAEINEQYKGKVGVHYDIEKAHVKGLVEQELPRIQKTRNEITEIISQLKTKKENTILTIDSLMFDSTIMIDTISKNFGRLAALCE
jgi:hypothetical protein